MPEKNLLNSSSYQAISGSLSGGEPENVPVQPPEKMGSTSSLSRVFSSLSLGASGEEKVVESTPLTHLSELPRMKAMLAYIADELPRSKVSGNPSGGYLKMQIGEQLSQLFEKTLYFPKVLTEDAESFELLRAEAKDLVKQLPRSNSGNLCGYLAVDFTQRFHAFQKKAAKIFERLIRVYRPVKGAHSLMGYSLCLLSTIGNDKSKVQPKHFYVDIVNEEIEHTTVLSPSGKVVTGRITQEELPQYDFSVPIDLDALAVHFQEILFIALEKGQITLVDPWSILSREQQLARYFSHAVESKDLRALDHLIVKEQIGPSGRGISGTTYLCEAVKYADVNVLDFLLKKNADPNGRSSDATTPLLVAVARGQVDRVKCLLDAKADPDIDDDESSHGVAFQQLIDNLSDDEDSIEIERLLREAMDNKSSRVPSRR